MATDEDPKARSLPPYPQMIQAAISALDEKDGSSKSAISKHIEVAHGDQLSPSHESLLAAHLTRMTEAGELVFVNDCYLHAGPDSPQPPKRGRGRPPKPKSSIAPAGPRRPRGRPPKPADPSAPVKVARPRGRPKKSGAAGSAAAAGPKRPRGRPPKIKPNPEDGFKDSTVIIKRNLASVRQHWGGGKPSPDEAAFFQALAVILL